MNDEKQQTKVPHDGIEWTGNKKSFYQLGDFWGIMRYMQDDESYMYRFYDCSEENNIDDCTPEVIDEIIAKLEHFKRVVFGEGN